MYDVAIDWSDPVNRAHPLNKGLAAWCLTGPSSPYRGTRTFRSLYSRGSNSGTLQSTVTWSPALGRPGGYGALQGNGSNAYAQFTGLFPGQTVNSFTLSLWVRPTTLSDFESVFGNDWTSTPGTLFANANGSLEYYESSTLRLATAGSVLANNTWAHLTLVKSGTALTLYRNGVVVDTGTGTNWSHGDASLRLMAEADLVGNGVWSGQVDDFRLVGFPYSASQARAIYDLSRRGYPGLFNLRRRPLFVPEDGAPADDPITRLLLLGVGI